MPVVAHLPSHTGFIWWLCHLLARAGPAKTKTPSRNARKGEDPKRENPISMIKIV
jgi:hypothetical protein